MSEKTGVIIVNTGSPASPDPADVAAYLEEFLMHPRIVPMNPKAWHFILKRFILPTRSKKSGAKYATIWTDEGFQFIRDHEALARKLTASYEQEGRPVSVACAMSFGEPSVPNTMRALREDGCTELLVLPLYPQNAFSQAGIVADDVAACAAETGWEGQYRMVGDYSDNDRYIAAIADSVREAGFDPEAGDVLVFSFHSIPCADIEAGDTYADTSRASSERIASELGLSDDQWRICYQSRFDKERTWLAPFTAEVLTKLAENPPRRLFFVCPNFAADCLETYQDVLHDIKGLWLTLLRESGAEVSDDSFVYVPCLGQSDVHVQVIRDVLEGYLSA